MADPIISEFGQRMDVGNSVGQWKKPRFGSEMMAFLRYWSHVYLSKVPPGVLVSSFDGLRINEVQT